MSGHISFHVGGPADCLVLAQDENAVAGVLRFCREENIPCYVMGNGTNLLVKDEGYRGVILKIGQEMSDISVEKKDGSGIIRAGAGALLSVIAKRALEEGLRGMEFAAGIPGSLGGAAVMNAGAYGGEMKDILRSVRLLTKTEHRGLSKEEYTQAYYKAIGKNKMAAVAKILEPFQFRESFATCQKPKGVSKFPCLLCR